jgi:hypothetical protein
MGFDCRESATFPAIAGFPDHAFGAGFIEFVTDNQSSRFDS